LRQPIETAKTAFHAAILIFTVYHLIFTKKICKAANCFRLTPRRYIGDIVMAEHHEPKKRKSGTQAAWVIDRPVVLVGMMGVDHGNIREIW
jgi:hypothetical protein